MFSPESLKFKSEASYSILNVGSNYKFIKLYNLGLDNFDV